MKCKSRNNLLARCGLAVAALFLSVPVAAPARDLDREFVVHSLRSATASDRTLATFYGEREFRPIWIRGDGLSSEAQRFVAIVRNSPGQGSHEADRLSSAIARAQSGDPRALLNAELQLTRALLQHSGQRGGNADMLYFDEELTPAAWNLEEVRPRQLRNQIRELRRGNPLYRQLETGLVDYRQRWARLPNIQVSAGGLRPGATGGRVRQLRKRLGLPEAGGYDAWTEQQVRAFQMVHGLEVDGLAGRATIAALNRGPAHYENLILANLERLRALPNELGRRFILVDAASARLWMFERGQPVDSMRVIVGRPDAQTPAMAAMMRYVLLNPYWNVPVDLARNRIAAGYRSGGAGWLREKGYQVLSNWSDNATVIDPSTVDWGAVAAGRRDIRVRQLPGPDNFMGDIKFEMPNNLGIYLHDTPDRHLFDQPGRQFSSGCIRLEDPQRLARWLFGRMPSTNSPAPEQRVNLPRPIPVYVTYLTAAPSEQGITFSEDTYRRDGPLLARLRGRGATLASRD